MAKAEIVPAPAPWVERMTAANKMLAEAADDPQRASRVWDFAEAARVYAIQVGLGVDAVNHAVAVKLKSQRLLAEAVDAGQAKGEITTRQTANLAGRAGKEASPSPGQGSPKSLDDIGVTRQRVSEARKIAVAFTDDDIDTAAADASLAGEELTSAQMYARAREVAARPVKDFLAGDQRVKKADYLHRVAQALPGALLKFDADEVAQHADEGLAQTMRDSVRGLNDWMARFEKARSGLRVVGGGKR